jgi:hypothetical protein
MPSTVRWTRFGGSWQPKGAPVRARRDPARLFDDAFADVMEIAEDVDQALNIVGRVLGV